MKEILIYDVYSLFLNDFNDFFLSLLKFHPLLCLAFEFHRKYYKTFYLIIFGINEANFIKNILMVYLKEENRLLYK